MSTILTQLSDAVAGIITSAGPSIVRIDGARRSPASGFALSADLVVTASHTIRARDGISVVRDDGQSQPATLVGADSGTDVALLRVGSGALHPIAWSKR